jgi:hypothetical protein
MKKAFLAVIVLAVALFLASAASSEEITYRKHIKPLFESKCVVCHGSDAAPEYYAFKEDQNKWTAQGQGMRMDTYSHLIFYTAWPDTGALMRRLNDGRGLKDGKPGKVGYEINFNRYFYVYKAPRKPQVIAEEIRKMEERFVELMKGVVV